MPTVTVNTLQVGSPRRRRQDWLPYFLKRDTFENLRHLDDIRIDKGTRVLRTLQAPRLSVLTSLVVSRSPGLRRCELSCRVIWGSAVNNRAVENLNGAEEVQNA
jgi:hypothetical protein